MGQTLDSIVNAGKAVGRAAGNVAGSIGRGFNRYKPHVDVVLDPALTYAATNIGGAAAIYAGVTAAGLAGPVLVGTAVAGGVALGAVDILLLPRIVGKMQEQNRGLREDPTRRRIWSWLKTAGLGLGLGIGLGQGLTLPEGKQVTQLEDINLKYDMANPMDEDSRITSVFGEPRGKRKHLAIDVSSPEVGQCLGENVYAVLDGVVEKAGRCKNGLGNYNNGNWITIDHGVIDNHHIKTKYVHMKKDSLEVPLDCTPEDGYIIQKGQKIGKCGGSGESETSYVPHLHFVLEVDGKAVDPIDGDAFSLWKWLVGEDNKGNRDVSETNINAAEMALLDTIAWAEGTHDAYNILYGGGNFEGYGDHPRKHVRKWGKTSCAAGRYQFMEETFDELKENGQFQNGFTPAEQDAAALYLLKTKRGVTDEDILTALDTGDFTTIAGKINAEWASITDPDKGDGVSHYKGQPARTLEALQAKFDQRYQARTTGLMVQGT
jgi:muramidase (phage lysozyme)/murein DD-endopeptidase MepM/ murein hydrolase activator NlpD